VATDAGTAREQVLWLLRGAHLAGRRAVDEAVRKYGITAAQLGVLNRLSTHPGVSAADLARLAMITPQAAQLALAALEKRGLVERTPDPHHGRIVRARLTVTGREMLDVALADALAAQDRAFATLDGAELQTLVDLLGKLV
jgi:DNA-binding MarR family transcriptional regulator